MFFLLLIQGKVELRSCQNSLKVALRNPYLPYPAVRQSRIYCRSRQQRYAWIVASPLTRLTRRMMQMTGLTGRTITAITPIMCVSIYHTPVSPFFFNAPLHPVSHLAKLGT